MCLVDRDKTDLHVLELRLEELAAQTLRGDIKELGISQDTVLQYSQDIITLHTTIDGSRHDTPLAQVMHLVFHQGYQGGDDDADTLHGKCRYLKGDGLATTCRHQSQCVMSGTDRLDDLPLNTPEVIIAPVLFKDLLIVAHLPMVGYPLSATVPPHACRCSPQSYRQYRKSVST